MVAIRRESLGLGRSLDQLFQDVFGAFAPLSMPAPTVAVFPALNVWQDEQAFHLEAEIPGVKLGDLELTLKGRDFALAGERKRSEGEAPAHSERAYGRFERRLRLPEDVETEQVSASLENGVLRVTLPKAARARARRIEIQAR
jgi:HSP20 family protein